MGETSRFLNSGKSWMEGGAFLRPYDLPETLTWSTENPVLWHQRELIYDETSRLILPLSALRGRCCVLAPPTYRIGRPADLPAIVIPPSEEAKRQEQEELHPLVFLCERLMTRTDGGELILKEIAPAYLKIITKVGSSINATFYFISSVNNMYLFSLFVSPTTSCVIPKPHLSKLPLQDNAHLKISKSKIRQPGLVILSLVELNLVFSLLNARNVDG